MRRFLGVALLCSYAIGLFSLIAWHSGVLVATLIFGFAIASSAAIVGAIYLAAQD